MNSAFYFKGPPNHVYNSFASKNSWIQIADRDKSFLQFTVTVVNYYVASRYL